MARAASPTRALWRSTRALWYALAGLMIVSPIGLLAAGTAWGEWGAEDFADSALYQAGTQHLFRAPHTLER